jgi:hypothetical protein
MDQETIKILAIAVSTEICAQYDRFFSGAEDDVYELVESILSEENRRLRVDSSKSN